MTWLPAVYVAVPLQAETPAQDPLELAVEVAAGGLVLVEVGEPAPPPEIGHVEPRTVSIQEASACGYCQAMTPPFQPFAFACATQVARVEASMYPPLVSSAVEAGFPMTSLLRSTPLAAIWKRAD